MGEQLRGVVDSLAAMDGVHERGFTFASALGRDQDLVLSFHELRLEAMRRARVLGDLGLVKGDRVALVIPEGHHFIPTLLGALWAGIVPVPLYPPFSLGKLDAFMDALASILRTAEPRLLVAGDAVTNVLWSVVGKVPSLEKIASTGDLAARSAAVSSSALPPPAPLAWDDLAFLQFTSGSTATPKGVMVTHGNLAANARAMMDQGIFADSEKDKGVSWLPLYHDMGLIGFVLAPVWKGVSIVFLPTLSFIKNATLWPEMLSRHRATFTSGPNFAYALVSKRARPEQIARWDLSSMRVFCCGAEPINPETMRSFLRTFAPAGVKPTSLLPAYGMAESTLAVSFIGTDEELTTDRIDPERYEKDRRAIPAANGAAIELVCCGRPFPGHDIRVVGEDGSPLPERSVGEIVLRGPSVSPGYFRSPEASRAAGMGPQGDGWLRTGDLGYLAQGRLYVSGRLKDIVILNGRNYDPQRIEWIVDEVPGVRRGTAVVFSRPGPASEELVVAVESRERDVGALVQRIVSRVSEELQLSVADVKVAPPGALPKTSSGKLQRRKTREHYLKGRLDGAAARAGGSLLRARALVAKHLAYSLVGRARHRARGLFRRLLP